MRRRLILLTALAASGCDLLIETGPPAPVLVFISTRDAPGRFEPQIYRVRADGSELVKLTDGATGGTGADWSPEGRRIVYASQGDLYVMSEDGTGRVPVTQTSMHDERHPRWSPDGTRILFARVTVDGSGIRSELFTVRPDGTDELQLTSSGDFHAYPAWSPDGSRIAFQRNRIEGDHIYVMNSDGSGVRQLTSGGPRNLHPDWSPDGTRIVFSRGDDNYDLYTVQPDGSDLRRITDTPAVELTPAWSPDGTRLAFASDRAGDLEVFTTRADGSDPVQVTNASGSDGAPRWRRGR